MQSLVAAYGEQLSRHTDGPESTRMSAEGQRFRFAKLMERLRRLAETLGREIN